MSQIKINEYKLIMKFLQNDFKSLEAMFFDILLGMTLEIQVLKKYVLHVTGEMEKTKNYIDDSDSYKSIDCIILSGSILPNVTNGENRINRSRGILH